MYGIYRKTYIIVTLTIDLYGSSVRNNTMASVINQESFLDRSYKQRNNFFNP